MSRAISEGTSFPTLLLAAMTASGPSCPGHLSVCGTFGIRQRELELGPIARIQQLSDPPAPVKVSKGPEQTQRRASAAPCALRAPSLCLCPSPPLPPQSLYVATSCQLRRLESARYSSVCSHMAETFQGSLVVRAFRAQASFTAQHDALMDENQRVSFPKLVADR